MSSWTEQEDLPSFDVRDEDGRTHTVDGLRNIICSIILSGAETRRNGLKEFWFSETGEHINQGTDGRLTDLRGRLLIPLGPVPE